jgi:hypothetical protein
MDHSRAIGVTFNCTVRKNLIKTVGAEGAERAEGAEGAKGAEKAQKAQKVQKVQKATKFFLTVQLMVTPSQLHSKKKFNNNCWHKRRRRRRRCRRHRRPGAARRTIEKSFRVQVLYKVLYAGPVCVAPVTTLQMGP